MDDRHHPGLSINHSESVASRNKRVLDRIATFFVRVVDADNQKDADDE